MKQKQKRTERKSVRKCGSWTKKGSWVRRHQLMLLIAAVVVLAALGVMALFGLRHYSGADVWVNIPAGATREAVRDSLRSSLGTVEGNRVYMLWRVAGGETQRARGRYLVCDGQLSVKTAWRIRGGMQTPVKVGWTDVRTLAQLAERVSRRMEFSADDFLAATDSVLKSKGWKPEEYAAAFVPDTYEFYATASAESVVGKLLDYRNKFWNERRTADAGALGLSPVEAATLASIVEEESAKSDERPVIARLYLNRLQRGMPLQADPTVKFATGNFALRRITGEHLRIESPYNTYRHRGLPPGPIRVASKAGIEAVLSAPEHEFLYMCAKEDFSGYHNFSTTYAEHQRNAARYQSELDKRGIKF